MNGGQSQVDTWDYKPELDAARRQGARGLRRHHRLLQGPGRPADAVAVPVRQARRVGDLGVGDLPPPESTRRRSRNPLRLLHRDEQPLAGALSDQHGDEPDGLPVRRLVGDLRAGDREPEPPRVRRDVRHARPGPAQGPRAELGDRLPAERLPGDRPERPGGADRQPRPPRRPDRRPAAAAARPARQAQRPLRRRPPGRGVAGGPDRVVRAGLPDADGRPRGARLRRRVRGDEAALRPRRPEVRPLRQAVPDGPPPGRAGRPLRPDLLRRHGERAELGRPLEHRGEPSRLRDGDRPADRRPCSPT